MATAIDRNFTDSTIRPTARGKTSFLPEPEPAPLWCPIISVDDHLLEPPDLFVSRLPQRLREAAPHVKYDAEGVPFWLLADERLPIIPANGASGRPMDEWTLAPQKYEEFRAGVSDSRQRLLDMDLNGVWASLCFPSLLFGFAGRKLSSLEDQDLGLACIRAYNDWVIEEWCAADRDRYIPCQLPWLNDPSLAAAEIRRNANRGFTSISFTEQPELQGLPSLYSDYWEPVWNALEETDTVVNLHIGSSGYTTRPSSVSPADVIVALFPVVGVMTAVDWIYSKIPVRHPALRIVLSEAGVSWVPTVIERLYRAHRQVEASSAWSTTDPHPVDVLRRSFRFTSIEDTSAFRQLDLIGVENVMLESDYPHNDSSWPATQPLVRRQIEHLDENQYECCVTRTRRNCTGILRLPRTGYRDRNSASSVARNDRSCLAHVLLVYKRESRFSKSGRCPTAYQLIGHRAAKDGGSRPRLRPSEHTPR
ncbi:MAG TPA: amidohydrolase family protein [Jatrophihabitantaceae bacterium]